jgi:hypothetical protein
LLAKLGADVTAENSPALECWVIWQQAVSSPTGTKERFCRPGGTCLCVAANPALKCWAIAKNHNANQADRQRRYNYHS